MLEMIKYLLLLRYPRSLKAIFENDPVIPIANYDVSCGNPLVFWKTFWATATATAAAKWQTKKNAHFSVTVNASCAFLVKLFPSLDDGSANGNREILVHAVQWPCLIDPVSLCL